MRPWRARLLYAGWSLLVALGILGAAEGVLYALGLPSDRRPAAEGAPAWLEADTLALWEGFAQRHGVALADLDDLAGWRWHGTLRWALRPHLAIEATNVFAGVGDGPAPTWRLETNSRGYRTPEFSDAPPPGHTRVITVGDSNTMGWLLEAEETYPRRLEVHLAQALRAPVEVINLGVGGYTTFSCRRTLLDVALRLSPDALVVSCGANDPQKLASSDADYAAHFGGPLGRLRYRLGQLRLVALLRELPTQEGSRAWVPRVSPRETERNLEAMFEAAHARDVPLVFLRVCFGGKHARPLLRAARRADVPVVNAFAEARRVSLDEPPEYATALAAVRRRFGPELLRERPELHYVFTDRCHLNALGADVAAAALTRELVPRLRAAPGEDRAALAR